MKRALILLVAMIAVGASQLTFADQDGYCSGFEATKV
jgi:hypothetical protein